MLGDVSRRSNGYFYPEWLGTTLPSLSDDRSQRAASIFPPQVVQPRGLQRLWELAVVAPAKWVLLKQDDRARRFIVRHGPLFQENKGETPQQACHHGHSIFFGRN